MPTRAPNRLDFSNLSYKTTEQTLLNFFAQYGRIEKLILYRDDQDQSLREGFVVYTELHSVNQLMSKRPHSIDQRTIFLQRNIASSLTSTTSSCMSDYLGAHLTVNEIFISRLCSGETRETFVNYFQRFGMIRHCRVFNSTARNPKQMGYAFVSFADYDSVGKLHCFSLDQWKRHLPIQIRSFSLDLISSSHDSIKSANVFHENITTSSHRLSHWASINRFGVIMPSDWSTCTLKPSLIPRDRTASLARCQPLSKWSRSFTAFVEPSNRSNSRYDPTASSKEISLGATVTKSPTNDFELITAASSLSSSISIVNSSGDDFTPLSSPLYCTAIAYSPTTDIIWTRNSNARIVDRLLYMNL